MSYTENFFPTYQKLTYSIGITCGVVTFSLKFLFDFQPRNALCTMSHGRMYTFFVILPLLISFILNLYINLKFGRDSYLKKFPKNYERFKLIFRVQRYYFITWTLTMLLCVLFHKLQAIILLIQPSCMVSICAFSHLFRYSQLWSQNISRKNWYINKWTRLAM